MQSPTLEYAQGRTNLISQGITAIVQESTIHMHMQADMAVYGANNWKAAEFDDQDEKERFEKLMVILHS